ncbi:hypothetical protein AMATHDRAFT_59558 [Amanita thiersii Skay4041]|uniref:Origin recognition complex subunit 6 n=1 Tax=Amanita thiersii Skay4041 TaxID=703135 RepID=A0A2A9NU67_9AGAR|nr:hypothetical protein AMATHDRAFT_59558 [Amanita thiersii Skay4041]
MAHNAHLLSNMNLQSETLELARSLLHEATLKTKPGSGHELGSRTTGLPAICAYIASQRLKTNEFTRQTAQVASCLRPTDFEKAFYIVQAVIGGSRRSTTKVPSFTSICAKYQVNGQSLEPYFAQAQRSLLQIDGRYNSERMAEVRFAIFFWVFSYWQGKKLQPEKEFAEDNLLSFKAFATVIATLSEKCTTLKLELIEQAKSRVALVPKAAPTPTKRSPQKRILRELPSKDSVSKKRPASPNAPEASLLTQPVAKILGELDSRPFPETPTKKRKIADVVLTPRTKPLTSTPLKSILRTSPKKGSAISTPSRVKLNIGIRDEDEVSESEAELDTRPLPALNLGRTRSPSSDGATSDADADAAEDSEMDELDGIARSPAKAHIRVLHPKTQKAAELRRFRPVYHDYKQWNTLDTRLHAIYAKS